MIRIGVIGLGHMGNYHATICTTLTKAQLVAIADPHPNNWKKITNAQVITSEDYRHWLHEVDAVIIATPTDTHYDIAKTCLLAGKHVLVEKPLTKVLEEAQELFNVARTQNCVLHVGHVERFNAALSAARSLVTQPYLIESTRMGPFTPRPQKDSVVIDLMIHDIDLVVNLVHQPISSTHVLGNKLLTDHDDVAIAQVKFANGTLAQLTASRTAAIRKRSMNIHQPNGCITIDFITQEVTWYPSTGNGVGEAIVVHKANALKHEIEYFVDAILSKQHQLDPQEDLRALCMAFSIETQLTQV